MPIPHDYLIAIGDILRGDYDEALYTVEDYHITTDYFITVRECNYQYLYSRDELHRSWSLVTPAKTQNRPLKGFAKFIKGLG